MPWFRPLAVSVAERMGSSGQVASGRISRDQGDGTVWGRLATAAAARGRCHLARHRLLGRRGPRRTGESGEVPGRPMSRD